VQIVVELVEGVPQAWVVEVVADLRADWHPGAIGLLNEVAVWWNGGQIRVGEAGRGSDPE